MIAANNPLSPKEHEAYCRKYGEDATKVYELILREPGTELPVAEIAQEIGKTNRTAMRATKKLVAHGLVTIQTTHGAARGANRYYPTDVTMDVTIAPTDVTMGKSQSDTNQQNRRSSHSDNSYGITTTLTDTTDKDTDTNIKNNSSSYTGS